MKRLITAEEATTNNKKLTANFDAFIKFVDNSFIDTILELQDYNDTDFIIDLGKNTTINANKCAPMSFAKLGSDTKNAELMYNWYKDDDMEDIFLKSALSGSLKNDYEAMNKLGSEYVMLYKDNFSMGIKSLNDIKTEYLNSVKNFEQEFNELLLNFNTSDTFDDMRDAKLTERVDTFLDCLLGDKLYIAYYIIRSTRSYSNIFSLK